MGPPPVDESKYPLSTAASSEVMGAGVEGVPMALFVSLPRVAPPGPGDDVGTVVVYSDGMARFESASGNVAWLTVEEHFYGYVC